jgi:phospholipid/cholesterol/gamma-HCH transport system substrate-binding protein
MKNEFIVGIFFFLAVAILGYFTIIMSTDMFKAHKYYKATVVFPNIDGLEKNSKVKVNGVLSGMVEDVKLMADNRVFVTLKLYNNFILYSSYKIKIRNETALGGKFVGIDPGTGFKDNKYYTVIDSRNNLKGESTADMFGELSDMIAENRANIYKTVGNIKEITAKINSGQGTLGKLVNENKV